MVESGGGGAQAVSAPLLRWVALRATQFLLTVLVDVKHVVADTVFG
jgi:hypothetical protein